MIHIYLEGRDLHTSTEFLKDIEEQSNFALTSV
jgi:hypothetical protein